MLSRRLTWCVVLLALSAGRLGQADPLDGFTTTGHPGFNGETGAPTWEHNWGGGGVVLKGYDVVEYYSLDSSAPGVQGLPQFAFNLTSSGYSWEFWFKDQLNLDKFAKDPWRWAPKYGGFCSYGTADEWVDNGWPWTEDTWGPPAGVKHGWMIHKGDLYFNINSYYNGIFRRNIDAFIATADSRWIDYFGSAKGGPFNTRCFPDTWRECASFNSKAVPIFGRVGSNQERSKMDGGSFSRGGGSFSGGSGGSFSGGSSNFIG